MSADQLLVECGIVESCDSVNAQDVCRGAKYMMFIESVRTCFIRYADFSGCASRSEFWWWVLFNIIAGTALDVVSFNISMAFFIVTLLPYMAVTTRRLHDTDRGGWLQLVGLVPIVGWILIIVWCAQEGRPNRYSSNQPTGSNRF